MPTITAQQIIDKVEVVLQDTTNVRWPTSELLGWLNDGQREIVMLRPDSGARRSTRATAAGTRQTIPDDGHMLIKVTRNMGAAGSTPGRAVRKVPQELLDSQVPDWHTSTASATTLHYTFDPREPRTFYIYPPAVGGHHLELVYSAAPVDCATLASVISLDDVYQNPLIDYVLYRAYSKDLDQAGNAERAEKCRLSFQNTLGMKAQADAASVAKDMIDG